MQNQMERTTVHETETRVIKVQNKGTAIDTKKLHDPRYKETWKL